MGSGIECPPGRIQRRLGRNQFRIQFIGARRWISEPASARQLLQKNPGYKVRVEGHTDIIGGTQSNDRLGLARANAVRDFLVKYGANPSQITTVSEGKQNPRYPSQRPTFNKTDEARWMNRRVALTVTDAQG